ncbi:tyrosine-type recombinase/integrase [Devosia sp.]|uniref:tyrosine-type recombinase/integrase n=1 Tax=Devosia sp. TaxID=1871048 RepID=UPI0035B17B18
MATNRLNKKFVDAAVPGKYADGGGLYLIVLGETQKRWVYRFTLAGKAVEYGLGTVAKGVDLHEARRRHLEARAYVVQGKHPGEAREQALSAAELTFGKVAEEFVPIATENLRNPKHVEQWKTTVLGPGDKSRSPDYLARLRPMPIGSITTSDVAAALRPYWSTVPETAHRVAGRVRRVFDYARANGMITHENPARWEGGLRELLGPPPEVKRDRSTGAVVPKGHQPAMPYRDMPAFYARLQERKGVTAPCLSFLILTATRSMEARGARWEEIDLESGQWVIPAARMKMGEEHLVPLSSAALALLKSMHADGARGLVFASEQTGRALSDSAMSTFLRLNLGLSDVTAHGMRATFRTWVGEESEFPREMAEHALAHNVGSDVERAYSRGRQAGKRRALMEAWAQFVTSGIGAEAPVQKAP